MLTAVLVLINLTEVFGGIAVAPRNIVVGVGEKLFLECRTNNESEVRKWTHVSTSGSTKNVYKHPDAFNPSFRHFNTQVNTDGSGSLYANSTRSEDAGIYGCEATVDGKDETFTAQVIVMESLPVCESNLTRSNYHSLVDGDHIWIKCNVDFRGFWAPSMEWTQHGLGFGPEGKRVTAGIDTVHYYNQKVTSKLTIALYSSTDYSCKIYFTNYSGTEVTRPTANNFPDFTYTWNSSVLYASDSSTSSKTQTTSSIDWYLVVLPIVSVLSIFLILMLTLAICIKKKASESAMRLSNIPDVANSQQIPPVSVYTEAKRASFSSAEQPRNQNSRHPTFSRPTIKVVKITNTSRPPIERATVKLDQKTPGSSISKSHDVKISRPPIYFGDDGTEYMEVNAVGRQPMSASHPTESNIMFSVVGEYASIDHTLSPPIPPR